jgi:hypothetical protein
MSKSKNINYHRVCLFIVEGSTDKIALNNILSKYFADKKLRTYIVGTDITSDEHSTEDNIVNNLKTNINLFLKREKLNKTDIAKIIHLTDLDGTFIDDSAVLFNKHYLHPYYTDENILTSHVDKIIERNHRKAANLKKLLATGEIYSIPYKIYFVSCNLEHLLHNKNNASNEDKRLLAEALAEKFLGKELTFLDFLRDEGVIDDTNYEESWANAQKENNSLLRKTNLDKALNDKN